MKKLKYKRKCTYKSCDATFYYGKRGLKLVIIQDNKTKKIVEILKEEDFDKCYERDYEVYDKMIDDIKSGRGLRKRNYRKGEDTWKNI